MLQTLNGANYNLRFEVFCLACGNSSSLTMANPLLGRHSCNEIWLSVSDFTAT